MRRSGRGCWQRTRQTSGGVCGQRRQTRLPYRGLGGIDRGLQKLAVPFQILSVGFIVGRAAWKLEKPSNRSHAAQPEQDFFIVDKAVGEGRNFDQLADRDDRALDGDGRAQLGKRDKQAIPGWQLQDFGFGFGFGAAAFVRVHVELPFFAMGKSIRTD